MSELVTYACGEQVARRTAEHRPIVLMLVAGSLEGVSATVALPFVRSQAVSLAGSRWQVVFSARGPSHRSAPAGGFLPRR